MKKLVTTLFIASAFTFSFAEDDVSTDDSTEDSTTVTSNRIEVTSTTEIDSSYNGSAITIPASGATWAMNLNLNDVTLDGDDTETATLYVAANGSNVNVNGTATINASEDSNAIYMVGNTIDFNINNGGYLTVNGDISSDFWNGASYFNLNSGGTLVLNGAYVAEGNINLSGTLIVGESGYLAVAARNSNNDSFLTTPDTFVTFNDGVVLQEVSAAGVYSALSTIEFFKTSSWKTNIQIYVLDNDALANTNLNLNAGTSQTYGYNTAILSIAFTNGTTSVAAGAVEIGSITISNYNTVRIDLTSIDSADGDSVIIDFLVGDTSTTMTSMSGTTSSIEITDFEDNIFNIGTGVELAFDEDNQVYLLINKDGTDYYIKVSVSDGDGTDISTGGFDVVNGFLNVSAVVPEPSTYAVILAGLALGLAMYRRRK